MNEKKLKILRDISEGDILREILQKWLTELKKELNEIEDFESGKIVEGIDDEGYCTGILNYGQPKEDYQEQLNGAIYFIKILLNMK